MGLAASTNRQIMAQEGGGLPPGLTLSVVAGFDGFYKSEFWLPVQVSATNSGPAIEGKLQITTGSLATGDRLIYQSPISLPTQSNKRITLYIYLPRFVRNLTVELLDATGVTVATAASSTLLQKPLDAVLYGVVSSEPGKLEFLERVTGRRSEAAVAFLDITSLPETPTAWNALDVLIFNDVDTGQLTANQQQALRAWLHSGGQLVVTGGPGWQKTTATLADLLPVTISGSETVADLPVLRQAAGQPFRDAGPYLVTTSSLSRGELLYHQDGLPLLARHSQGRGHIYFLALDPRLAPLLDWNGREAIWTDIVGSIPLWPYGTAGFQNSRAAGTAVATIAGLALPSAFQLFAFLCFYILAIGPVNYLILKRLKRREMAWVSIPAIVLLFSGMTYVISFQIKGNNIILNEMSLAYGQALLPGSADGGEENQIRVQSLVGLYSPHRSTFDLVFPAETMARPFNRDFGILAGSGTLNAIVRDNEVTLERVQVDVGAVETFVVDSYQPTPSITGQATLELDGSDIRLEATIQNDSGVTLENASLLLSSRAISLGNIPPGGRQTISEVIGTAAAAGSTSPPPFSPSGSLIYATGTGYTLSQNADVILGTTDYYEDPVAFPRWQLLLAVDNSISARSSGGGTASLTYNAPILAAWSSQNQLDIKLSRGMATRQATTLYLLELPLEQNLINAQAVSIPVAFLNWEVIEQSNVYEAAIQNFYLNGGHITFEYTPWPEFHHLKMTELAVRLTRQDLSFPPLAPEVALWDWQQETWIVLAEANWGETAVPDPARFIGSNNAVRLRLQDNQLSTAVGEVYPLLTGNFDP